MAFVNILLLIVCIYLAIKLYKISATRKRLARLVDEIPGPPNIPFLPVINHAMVIIYLDSLNHKLGTFFLTYHVLSNMYRLFPDTGICRFWLGWKPIVVLYSPENVEAVLNSTTVLNKADEYRFFEPWIGEGLVTSKRNKWRFRRKILTPAFHFRILNDFMPVMNQEASKLVFKLNQSKYLGPDNVFDITSLVALCTLDTICETAMGVNINCQDDEQSEYVRSLHKVAEIALSRVTRPWLWPDIFFNITESGQKFHQAKDRMHAFTTRVILERKALWETQVLKRVEQLGGRDQKLEINQDEVSSVFSAVNKRMAFLDLMLHQHLIEKTMSIEDIREEVDTFMFAGHDTTAMCISWTLYMLGLHKNIQNKVREELDEILNYVDEGQSSRMASLTSYLDTKDISVEHIRQMKYLDRVIKESLRLWPSIPFVARQMTDDIRIKDKYLIPKGVTCMVYTQALHNNPKYFPKPEIFDPDRFLPENVAKRHPFAYIPFSAGPRNCIGQKFAQMEVKVILAKVIRNYIITTPGHRDQLALVGELVLRSRNGLNITLEPRFKS